jgi:hypothetical protein
MKTTDSLKCISPDVALRLPKVMIGCCRAFHLRTKTGFAAVVPIVLLIT